MPLRRIDTCLHLFAASVVIGFLLAGPGPAWAACQGGDPCTAEICSAGCLSFACSGGTYVPLTPLPSGAPCQDVATGVCEQCTCGDLGAQIFSDRPAGSVCGESGACESNTCDGEGTCVRDPAPPGTLCGLEGQSCDGDGMCVEPEIGGDLNPGSLLVYYGIPSLINGAAGNLDSAASELGRYDVVVLGAGLEVPPGEPGASPEHLDTAAIVAHPAAAATRFFGYIDLGVQGVGAPLSNFSVAEVVQRAAWWLDEIGVEGIFLDDYGYDFCVSRQRQNDAIQGIRAVDLARTIPIIANAFRPDDVFGVETSHAFATPWCDATVPEETFVANPTGVPALLGPDDFYLFESHQVINGEFEANDFAFDWQFKSQYVDDAQATIGFGILSVTTVDGADPFDEDQFFYSWHSAALYGHVATGWGEVEFSAPTSQAPYRARPSVDLGDMFVGDPPTADGPRWSVGTDRGEIFIDTRSHAYGFVPEPGAAARWVSVLGAMSWLARSGRRGAGCESTSRRRARS